MNKKISTIFAMAALMGGSLFSSAYAATDIEDLVSSSVATTLDESKQFAMIQTYGTTDYYYGLKKANDGKLVQMVIPDTEEIEDAELSYFAWRIEIQDGIGGTTYRFQNVGTGEYLRVISVDDAAPADNITAFGVALDPSEQKDYIIDQFIFDAYQPYNGNQYLNPYSKKINANGNWTYVQFYDGSSVGSTDELKFAASATTAAKTVFKEIESKQVTGDVLNKLYNSKGFSFSIKADDEVVENPFQDLRAIQLTQTVNVVEDQQKWGFPAGTYFVTKESYDAMKEDFNNSWTDDKKLEFLRQLTFVAVSSTESIEVTGVDRANGQGFEFVQISGNDLYDYIGTDLDKQPQNDQLSVYNACFHVEALSTDAFPYSIKLEKFFYVADADALAEAQGKGEDYEQADAEVNIEVLKHGSPAAYYLTTSEKTTNDAGHIFKFDQSNIKSGISFLKTDGPAVYNIRFVSGDDDSTERGKYLTLGTNGSTFEFFAKGEALADAEALATPAYQFVITNVKGNDVTFTNRETGQPFTTQLFLEGEENGLPVYSLAEKTYNHDISIVNIKSNSYATEVATDKVKMNSVEIQLIPSEVDPCAGFLNVDEETLMTMKFARDAYSTSNFWYASVDSKNNLMVSSSTNEANLTDDLYSAAQWQFVKVDSVELKRDYAYNNNNVVAIKGYGDVMKAYVYAVRYVVDGSETDKYLNTQGTSAEMTFSTETEAKNADSKYIVRTNPDGSVMLIKNDKPSKTTYGTNVLFKNDDRAFAHGTEAIAELELKGTTDKYYAYTKEQIYDVVRGDEELLTFLVNESPEISWPEEEGHVTIQSAGGDYLTIDTDNNDAIIIDEANADPFYLHVTDKNAIVPSFYISKGMGEGSTAESERMFLFNPIDSAQYQVNMDYDPEYQLDVNATKAVFKSGILNETRDTLSLTVKGEVTKKVAMKSNNQQNVWGGLNRFKFQIIETEDGDAYYYIRQPKADKAGNTTWYLANINDEAAWVAKGNNMVPPYEFVIETIDAPTANEGVSATEVKVIAVDGAINIKNAAGKNVVVSTILGQIVANEVLISDNATISVPAGIAIVSVDGEEAVKVSVR